MDTKSISILLAGVLLSCSCADKGISVGELTTEMRVEPTVNTMHPRFSWKVYSDKNGTVPTAYDIKVTDEDGRTVWHSGKVGEYDNVLVTYEGKDLRYETDYEWKVRVWTTDGRSAWSEPAKWSTGLADSLAWCGAEWIGINERWKLEQDENHLPARYLRKEFVLDGNVRKAKLYFCALGMGDASINGDRVCRDLFAHPAVLFHKTLYYRTYDVTDMLHKGDNVLSVLLGSGRYQTMGSRTLRGVEDPRVKAVLKVTYTDGRTAEIISDTTWMGTSEGPITMNNEFDGEYYDARMEMPGWNTLGYKYTSVWKQVDTLYDPKGHLQPMPMDDMSQQDEVSGKTVRRLADGSWLVDLEQNMVGLAQMTLSGIKDSTIVIRYAEKLLPDGSAIDQSNLRAALGTDKYTPARDGRFTWTPVFPYHGFRFMQISGVSEAPVPSEIIGKVTYDKMTTTGTFECSDDRLNQLFHNIFWGIRSNYRSMPIDCPQRNERQGWMGDRAATIWGEPYIFGCASLYRKWMDDVYTSMSRKNRISVVSPRNWTIYNDDTAASIVYLYMADMLYTRYGDDSGIKVYYDSMKAWFATITRKNLHNGIFHMKFDEYRDWVVPPEEPTMIHSKDPNRQTDSEVIQTGILCDAVEKLIKFARYTGNGADVPGYEAVLAEVKKAYNEKFFNSEGGYYSNNTMTANLIPLRFGIVPEGREQDVLGCIIKRIHDNGDHLAVGNVGIRYPMQLLTKYGYIDLAYRLATIDSYPGWGYMIKNGATTVWELWNGDSADPSMNSGNHAHLIGDLLCWYFENLAGIQNDPSDIAFRKIVFKPSFPKGLDRAGASFNSPRGLVSSAWTLDYDSDIIKWDITVPVGSTATAIVPAIFNIDTTGLDASVDGGVMTIHLGSGQHTLRTAE